MKQLYIIGILLAVVLIALLGLSKLVDRNGDAGPTAVAETEPSEETNEQPSEADITPDIPEASMTPTQTSDVTNVTLKTNKGEIVIELFTGAMPITTENFLTLARKDFYDGIKFHRVIDGFMIQGGDPLTKNESDKPRWGTGGPGYSIKDEFGEGLSNVRGTIAMANAGPNTGGSQFFINTVDNTFLDAKHPVFGKVVSGMEVVDAVSKIATGPGDVPLEAVVIEDVAVE